MLLHNIEVYGDITFLSIISLPQVVVYIYTLCPVYLLKLRKFRAAVYFDLRLQ